MWILLFQLATLPEGHSQRGVPVYREREPGYSSRVLQREFPATQCTPVRELQNSVPENIFFCYSSIDWQHGELVQESCTGFLG